MHACFFKPWCSMFENIIRAVDKILLDPDSRYKQYKYFYG